MALFSSILQKIDRHDVFITIVDIETISDIESEYIKKNLVEICKGPRIPYLPGTLAKKLLSYLERATDSTRHGATAEFFQTIILRSLGFEQHHCYRNLEENSIKKGFDGLFVKDGEAWEFESKSSYLVSSHNNKHKGTIDKAYKGIKNMLSGNTTNDPWENAINHSVLAKSEETMIKRLIELSEGYQNNIFQKIDESNVILGSTIFTENLEKVEKDLTQIQNYIQSHNAKSETIVIVNLTNIDLFIEVLGEIANG